MKPLSPLREREGPAGVSPWEGEGVVPERAEAVETPPSPGSLTLATLSRQGRGFTRPQAWPDRC